MKKLALAAAALLASTSMPAFAAPIVYTLSGNFSGFSGTTGFTNEAGTFTAVGDTGSVFLTPDGSRNVILSSLRVTAAAGNVYHFIGATPISLRFGTNNGYAGFIVEADGNNPSVFLSSGLSNYDGVSNVSTTNVDYVVSNGVFPTILNGTTPTLLTISGQNSLQFSAAVAPLAAAAVPEPATWAMMLVGFGMVGFGLRSRRKSKVTTRVAFA